MFSFFLNVNAERKVSELSTSTLIILVPVFGIKNMFIKSKGRSTAKTTWKDKQHTGHAHTKTFKKTDNQRFVIKSTTNGTKCASHALKLRVQKLYIFMDTAAMANMR